MPDNILNRNDSSRVQYPEDSGVRSRYSEEFSGYALAGDRTESRLELTHRDMLDVSEIINYRKYTWYDIEELDRLDLIAFEYLGDSRLWWVIADLNFDLIKDTQILHPGVKIRLPNAAALEELGI